MCPADPESGVVLSNKATSSTICYHGNYSATENDGAIQKDDPALESYVRSFQTGESRVPKYGARKGLLYYRNCSHGFG